MDGEVGIGDLADRFSDMAVRDSSRDGVVQIMRALEDAEVSIRQQLEENIQLKDELLRQTREIEKYKQKAIYPKPSTDVLRDGHTRRPYNTQQLSHSSVGNEAARLRWRDNEFSVDHQGISFIHQNGIRQSDGPHIQSSAGSQYFSDSSNVNGTHNVYPGDTGVSRTDLSQLSAPSARFLYQRRYQKESEYPPGLTPARNGDMPLSEITDSNIWKQDLAIKVREQEEVIVQLRKHLAEYRIKEAQTQNEKYILEKRIAEMRKSFDMQQQDLVDAATKALSYRQDIIEENIRLTYALQAAQQEISTFMSSLLPLLTEYSFQPPVLDAQSVVSNLKVLFKHLEEKLILTEEKVKESQYQFAPWGPETVETLSHPQRLPSHSLGAALASSTKNSMDIVPKPQYSYGESPGFNAETTRDWIEAGNQTNYDGSSEVATKNLNPDNLGVSSPAIRKPIPRDMPDRGSQDNLHTAHISAEYESKNPLHKDMVRVNEMDDSGAAGPQHSRAPSVPWNSGSSPHLSSGLDDANSSYPYLPPVLEEPSSSFSEAAEDDPLPGIEGLQISGEAFPGRELLANGYSINGTTSCIFEWVRYLEDGSVNYIDGAKQPKYLVTADDVDSFLAIEVQPLDNKQRKGDLVMVFANEQRKITCDPEIKEQIERTLSIGHVSFEVSLLAASQDIWESANLSIKREAFSIKCYGPRGVITEKFLPPPTITIPYGHPTEFSIHCANGDEYLLSTADGSTLRDTIVLTMRLFIIRAAEKRQGRKKGLFFK